MFDEHVPIADVYVPMSNIDVPISNVDVPYTASMCHKLIPELILHVTSTCTACTLKRRRNSVVAEHVISVHYGIDG